MNALSMPSAAHDGICLSSDFIDQYIPKTNGEFIKVYLYILRHISGPASMLSLTYISDQLGQMESDVYRGLKFWVNEGLLKIIRDDLDHICSIELLPQKETRIQPFRPTTPTPSIIKSNMEQPIRIHREFNEKEWKRLLQTAQTLLGRLLPPSDVEILENFYKNLNMSYNLIIHLLETCVDRGITNFKYIQKVGLNWFDEGVTTPEQASVVRSDYSADYIQIKQAFGIKDRRLATAETEMIDQWFTTYSFTIEIVLEACNQTILNLSKADFHYANKILKNWFEAGHRTIDDIRKGEEAFERERKSKTKSYESRTSAPKKNGFKNFKEREYDMNDLERKLLNSNW